MQTSPEPKTAHPLPPEEGLQIDVKGLLHALLRQSWIIILLGLAGCLAGMWYAKGLQDSYSSTAVVEVQARDMAAIKVGDNGQEDLRNPEAVQTIVENFHNRSLLKRVVRALDLTKDIEFAGPERLLSEESIIRILQHSTTATIRPKTRLIDVTAVHPNPEMARKIADALVEEFLKLEGEQSYSALGTRNGVLVEKSAELRGKLELSEAALQEYQKKMGSVSLEESRNLITAKLSTLSGQLTTARSEVQRLEADLKQIQLAGEKPDALLAIGSIAKDAGVIAAQQKIATQQSEIAALADRYREKHPKMIEARSQLESQRQALTEAVRKAPNQLINALTAARTEEKNLSAAVAEQEKAALDLDEKLMPFKTLQREAETDRSLYEGVLAQMKQSNLAMGVDPVPFRIVEPAVPSPRLASRRFLIAAGSGLFGALFGIALVAGFFLLDSSIRTVDDAERLLNLPVLAAVPSMRKFKSPRKSLTVVSQPGSAAAESFRSLRTSLTLSGPQNQPKIVLVTSAVPGEGKTLTSANIAIAFAQQGMSTLLIDADLRKPTVGKLFELPPNQPGLADCLVGHTLELVDSGIPHLAILPSGPRAVFPAELLTGPAMADLLARLGQQFSRIVIDSAPVNVVSDTLNFAASASAVCLVVRSRKTSLRVVRRAVELLRRAKVRPIGIALNWLPSSNGHDYHYYYASNDKYGGDGTYGGGYSGTTTSAVPELPPGLAAAKVAGPT